MEAVPDGGWGWAVVTGMAFMFIVSMGTIPTFGVIYGDYLQSLGEGTTSVTIITSVYMAMCFTTGLLMNRLTKSYSFRQIGCSGAGIYFMGALLSSFVDGFLHLVITYGILQGIGLGLMIPAAFSSFNSYFKERRTRGMAVSQTMNAVGCFVMPLFVQLLMDNYDFRGAQLIMSAVTLHALLGMVALQPVENYMEKRSQCMKMSAVHVVDAERQVEPLISEHSEVKRKITLSENNEFKEVDKDEERRNMEYVTSLKWDWIELQGRGYFSGKACSSFFRLLVEIFDLRLLTDPVYINISVGLSFTNVADITFFALEPIYLEQSLGFTKSAASSIIAVGAAGDVLGRLVLALSSQSLSQRNRLVYFLGCVGSVLHILAFIFITNFYVIATMTGILGFFRGCIYVSLPLVFAEVMSVERYPAAIGLYHAMTGITFLTLGPFIGMIRDVSDSYPVCFFALACLMSMCVLLWTLEVISRRMKCKIFTQS